MSSIGSFSKIGFTDCTKSEYYLIQLTEMDIVLARREFTATGGAELYLKRLIQALISKNHKVSLITGDANAKMKGSI